MRNALSFSSDRLSKVYFRRGNAKIGLKDYKGAITDYTEAIEINSRNAKIYYNRGFAKYETLDYWGSISDFNYAIRESPNDAKAYFRRGLVKIEVQNYKGAADDFFTAVIIDSEIVHFFCKKCFSAIKLGTKETKYFGFR